MTDEEAVKLLEDIKSRVECIDVYIDEEEGEALDFAINAIKIQGRLLQLCEQVNEDDKMVFVGINDIRAILKGEHHD